MYSCRECERPINQATEICPYCGADLTVSEDAGAGEGTKKSSLASVLVRLGIVVAALWAFLWFSMPREAGDPVARAEAQAVASLREVGGHLQEYSESQGGSFPDSLEVLGERARLPAQQALREGYSLIYTPGPLDEQSRVRSFSLEARPGKHGYSSYYTDQIGVVRSTRAGRPATAQDPPVQ